MRVSARAPRRVTHARHAMETDRQTDGRTGRCRGAAPLVQHSVLRHGAAGADVAAPGPAMATERRVLADVQGDAVGARNSSRPC